MNDLFRFVKLKYTPILFGCLLCIFASLAYNGLFDSANWVKFTRTKNNSEKQNNKKTPQLKNPNDISGNNNEKERNPSNSNNQSSVSPTNPMTNSTNNQNSITSPINISDSQDDNNQSTIITINVSDFEDNILGSYWNREMANNTYSGTISGNYAFSGSKSLRIELRNTDSIVNSSKRSEISTYKPEAPNEEMVYEFSVLLPNGGEEDYAIDPEGSEIIAQWHNTPDPGEEWTYPPLALHTYKDHYELWRCWDDAEFSTDEQIMAKGNFVRYNLGYFSGDKGKFVTWKFHIKWGWLVSQHPFIEVYKNNIKILDLKDAPNAMNDKNGVYQKLGIYKWNWAQPGLENTSILTRRVIYYDNVIVSKY